MKPLKSRVEIPYQEGVVSVDVNWGVIEICERVFGGIADTVASDTLIRNPQRYKIAEAMAEILHDKPRSEVREAVITSTPEVLGKYIGFLQGAILYTLKYIDEDDLNKLSVGEDLGEETSKKAKASSETATS